MAEQDGTRHDDALHVEETTTEGTKTVDPRTATTDPTIAPATTDAALTDSVYPPVTGFEDPTPPARRRGPDPLALLVGLATLAMAIFAFVGELPDLPDPRWMLAGGAALVGLVLLVGSLRGRSRGRRG